MNHRDTIFEIHVAAANAKVPQAISVKAIRSGYLFIKVESVNAYVAYMTKPIRAARGTDPRIRGQLEIIAAYASTAKMAACGGPPGANFWYWRAMKNVTMGTSMARRATAKGTKLITGTE